jgi:hypothetical protein
MRMLRSTTHRFPKWLLDERFEITHTPNLGLPFGVVLFDKRTSARRFGYGNSIAEAAKEARKKRVGK